VLTNYLKSIESSTLRQFWHPQLSHFIILFLSNVSKNLVKQHRIHLFHRAFKIIQLFIHDSKHFVDCEIENMQLVTIFESLLELLDDGWEDAALD
jgi:hypothetical protein